MPSTDAPRLLFRYITVEEWADYRAIISVFAGTFFREFAPDDVTLALAERGYEIDPAVVTDRLDKLCEWGNLTVSASVGNPSSLADYYRRRNRYLITRAGQEVHDVIESVLQRVDEVRDVSVSRLDTLLTALEHLATLNPHTTDAVTLAGAVRAVFDPHLAFTTEITQFFASINQWQTRFDLDPDEFRFFAEVLIGYVGDRLAEIERLARPIARVLQSLAPSFAVIAARARDGLAARVADAGITSVTVTHTEGSAVEDWQNLGRWFVSGGQAVSRVETLTGQAVSAIRTLTQNLTRLSRSGLGSGSRRAELLALATRFHNSTDYEMHRVAVAALAMHPPCHLGSLPADVDDPVPASTSWLDAPPAVVPVAMRERGEVTIRGLTSPMRDRTRQKRQLHEQRELVEASHRRFANELLALSDNPSTVLSAGALARLEELLSLATAALSPSDSRAELIEGDLRIVVHRKPGADVTVRAECGTLTLFDLAVEIGFAPAVFTAGDDK